MVVDEDEVVGEEEAYVAEAVVEDGESQISILAVVFICLLLCKVFASSQVSVTLV